MIHALINMELETLFSNVILRFSFNLIVAFVIIKLIYHRDYKGNDFVFTYFMFNTLIFFFAYILGNLDINMAFGFGLFAVFAILRYRTDPIPIKEMTYLFIVITTGVINALSTEQVDSPNVKIRIQIQGQLLLRSVYQKNILPSTPATTNF